MSMELVEVQHSEPTEEEVQTRGVIMSMLAEGKPFVFLTTWAEGEYEEDFNLNVKLESSFGQEDNDILKAVLQAALSAVSE